MKRELYLKNSVVVASVFVGLLFTASSFTFGLVENVTLVDNPPQKKEQRVKVIVNKDGKETKIDTTFNLPDEKMINCKVDSILKKFDIDGIESGNLDALIRHKGNRMRFSNHAGVNFPGDEKFDILIQNGDSGILKHEKRIFHFGNDSVYSFDDQRGNEFNELLPPPPPIPPYPPMMMYKQFDSDPFAFNEKDGSIISYDKKDIGKGLEKITIIRKKQVENRPKREIEMNSEESPDSDK